MENDEKSRVWYLIKSLFIMRVIPSAASSSPFQLYHPTKQFVCQVSAKHWAVLSVSVFKPSTVSLHGNHSIVDRKFKYLEPDIFHINMSLWLYELHLCRVFFLSEQTHITAFQGAGLPIRSNSRFFFCAQGHRNNPNRYWTFGGLIMILERKKIPMTDIQYWLVLHSKHQCTEQY